MKLYMVRHGESVANSLKCHAGQMDFELTDKGREGALKCRENLKGLAFDKVLSSDLARAHDTQKIAYPSDTCEPLKILREVDVGALAGNTISYCTEVYGEQYVSNRIAYNFKDYGGEDYHEIKGRAEKFLELVLSYGVDSVIAFSHGGFIKTLFDVIFGVKLDKLHIKCDNCGIFAFEYKDGIWSVILANYTELK